MNERLKEAYKKYATLALRARNTDSELCIGLHTDNEAVGEVRLCFDEESNTVYAQAVYPDGKYAVLVNWTATAEELANILNRSTPAMMREFMLERIVRKDVLFNYPEDEKEEN